MSSARPTTRRPQEETMPRSATRNAPAAFAERSLLIAALLAPLLLLLPSLLASQQPHHVTVPAGTTIMVRLLTDVSTRQHTGARFETVLVEDLRAGDVLVARAGAPAYGTITRSEGGK